MINKDKTYSTTLHEHPLVEMLGRSNRKWFCHATFISANKKCLRVHSMNDSRVRTEKGYYCVNVNQCEFFLCDMCLKESMAPSEKRVLTTLHKHSLSFYQAFPTKWYCDALDKCESNHKKSLEYRNSQVYFCKECDFYLCELDAQKHMINLEKQKDFIKSISEKTAITDFQTKPSPLKIATTCSEKKQSQIQKTKEAPIDDALIQKSMLKNKYLDFLEVEVFCENYEKTIKFIGKGGFGSVYQVNTKLTPSKTKALKIVKFDNPDEMKSAILELNNMSRVKNHPNILCHDDFFLSPPWLFIEMELGDQNLEKLIEQNTRLDEETFRNYFKQIAKGLSYAHGLQMAHLDIKPQNIMLFGKVCKIADWGGSYQLKTQGLTSIKNKDLTISNGYFAPEIEEMDEMKNFNYFLCDIYSLGILGFRCLGIPFNQIKKIPLNDEKPHQDEIIKMIASLKASYSIDLLNLLAYMVSFLPQKRIKLEELLERI